MSVVSFQTFEEPAWTKPLLLRDRSWERLAHLRHLVNHKRSLLPCSLPQGLSLHYLISPCLLHAPFHVPPVCWPYRGVWITSVQLAPWRLSLVSKLEITIRIILPQQPEADLVKRSWASTWNLTILCSKQWHFVHHLMILSGEQVLVLGHGVPQWPSQQEFRFQVWGHVMSIVLFMQEKRD